MVSTLTSSSVVSTGNGNEEREVCTSNYLCAGLAYTSD